MRTLFTGGAVVVSADVEWETGFVLVEDEHIAAAQPGPPPPELMQATDTVVDTSGKAVMPGFVNAHCHLFQSMLRGISTNRSLESWLEHDIWPNVVRLEPDDFYLAALSGIVENLRNGVTSILENHYVHTSPGNIDQVARAFADSGIRGLIARGAVDRDDDNAFAPSQPRYLEDRHCYIDNLDAFLSTWHGAAGGRIRGEAAVQTTWLASPELCQAVADYTHRAGIGVHAHCAETRASVASTVRRYGLREVDFFAEHGLLGPNTQLVHCVWLDEDERDRLAQTETLVVSCPVSNAYLASGPAPLSDYRDRGIAVALGADGPGSNNGQNMHETVKWSVLSGRLSTLDATLLDETDALSMVWDGGARALGLPGKLGQLRPGCLADLVVVDICDPAYDGSPNVRKAVVFAGNPRNISQTWVGGQQVVADGRVRTVDEAELSARVRSRMRELALAPHAPTMTVAEGS